MITNVQMMKEGFMQRRIPAVFMRGGTSKAIFFHRNHLPGDRMVRDRLILAAYGSPDPYGRQLDGMGGAVSSTSKIAVMSLADDPDYDVDFEFGQVGIDSPLIDYLGSCGNIVSAVGPFAVDEGLVRAREPITVVRIHQINTDKCILAEVPVTDGRFEESGKFFIDGVPEPGSLITLHFMDPGGSVTGRLLPTGKVVDTIQIPGLGNIEVSIIDAGNPLICVKAADLGLQGTEIDEIDKDSRLKQLFEDIRSRGTVMMGLASSPEEATEKSQAVPKIACVSPPRAYRGINGRIVDEGDIDLVARIISMGVLHKAYTVTGAIATACAARMEGSIVRKTAGGSGTAVRIGHPSGIMKIDAHLEIENGTCRYVKAVLGRTARRLMEGSVLVPERFFKGTCVAEN